VILSYSEQSPALKSLQVKCTKDDGSENSNASWTLSVPAAASSWLKLSLKNNIDFNHPDAGSTISSTGSQTVYIYTTANPGSSLRIATISLSGREATTIIQDWDITVNPGVNVTPKGVNTYVGAFWRAGQRGERLININMGTSSDNLGRWQASVAWADDRWNPDDIVLALGGSPNISAYAEDAANRVTGDAVTVGGEVKTGGEIAFRIGLKSTYQPTSTYPARYAIITLLYNNGNKMQKLFLRQGEGDDYVLRPKGDPINIPDYSRPDRPNARKFSPFNLTAKVIKGGEELSGHPQRPVGGGVFVDYPTQAGAFFQWSSTNNPRRAYHPVDPSGKFTNYPIAYNGDFGPVNWTPATNETCPPGYRRASDKKTSSTDPMAGLELRQSLWINPPIDISSKSDAAAYNSLYGLYADGYFDRAPIEASVSKIAGMTVYPTSKDVAYGGRLFYNPTTAASVFFPALGFRDETTGQVGQTGRLGYYWSSTPPGSQNALVFRIGLTESANAANMWTATRTAGGAIRCVKDE
jgi:hypothetical protein